MRMFKIFEWKRNVFLCAAFAIIAVLSLQFVGCAVEQDDDDDDSAEQALMDRIAIGLGDLERELPGETPLLGEPGSVSDLKAIVRRFGRL